jgi:2-C-methyl-D-erythritol 4-phosphate cytidylyltransferase
MRVAAIVLAGGRGNRVRSDVNKVFLPVRDQAVLDYSIATFKRAEVAQIVIVARPEDRDRLAHLTSADSGMRLSVVDGGDTRHQSEMSALVSVAGSIESEEIDLIAIHDGARPFMSLELLNACIDGAARFGGAIPGTQPEAPIYQLAVGGVRSMESAGLVRVQTPQVFKAGPLLEAYRAAAAAGFEGVDTAETVEKYSALEVVVVPGDERNLKITFIEDLFKAEDLAANWSAGTWNS